MLLDLSLLVGLSGQLRLEIPGLLRLDQLVPPLLEVTGVGVHRSHHAPASSKLDELAGLRTIHVSKEPAWPVR